MSLKFSRLFVLLVFAPAWAWGMRIVSLLPSNTEIIEALGSGDEIVGVTRFDRGPLGSRQVVGDLINPNMEKIVSLHPDLIVAGSWTTSHVVPRLRDLGYNVWEVRNPRSLDEVYDSIRSLAKAIGRESAAEPVIRTMQNRFHQLQAQATERRHRWKTYLEIDQPYWTVGGHDFLTEALVAIGLDNIFSDLQRPSAQVAPEVIIERQPELILSFNASRSAIKKRPGWESIPAVRNNHILDDLNQDDLSHPSPRLMDGLEALSQKIQALGPS